MLRLSVYPEDRPSEWRSQISCFGLLPSLSLIDLPTFCTREPARDSLAHIPAFAVVFHVTNRLDRCSDFPLTCGKNVHVLWADRSVLPPSVSGALLVSELDPQHHCSQTLRRTIPSGRHCLLGQTKSDCFKLPGSKLPWPTFFLDWDYLLKDFVYHSVCWGSGPFRIVMVETAGVEPASESPPSPESTCVVYSLDSAGCAHKQAHPTNRRPLFRRKSACETPPTIPLNDVLTPGHGRAEAGRVHTTY